MPSREVLTSEQKIARGVAAVIVKAIVLAEGRAAVARARDQDPAALEHEARALRVELARVEALAEGKGRGRSENPNDSKECTAQGRGPLTEDAGPAAQSVMDRLARPRGDVRVQDLRRELAGIEEADPIRWPGADPAEVEASPHGAAKVPTGEPDDGEAPVVSASPPRRGPVLVAPSRGDLISSGRSSPAREVRAQAH